MIAKFQNRINTHFSFLKTSRLLVAISGGIDSVVLTHLCHQFKLHIALAHCNFNLRGDESDADEDFVLDLAENLDVEVFIESFDTNAYAKAHKLSIQMAARDLRYHWFQELKDQLKFDFILTAHHADDNLETFLINLSRGTGLDGLTGIPEINGALVRLLLPFSRQDIQAYAKEHHLKWRDDSSNVSSKYLRNKLRHEVIPVLKEINPQVLQNFQTTVNNLKDTADMVDDALNAVLKRAIVTIDVNTLKVKILEFKTLKNPKAYLYEFLKDFGFTEWNDVVHLLDAQSGKQVFSSSHRLLKDRDYLILTNARSDKDAQLISIAENDTNIQIPSGVLHFNQVDGISATKSSIIYVDHALLKYPLAIRKWQEGDVFYPLGMKGKKKLSKYLKDEKLSLIEKENIWLLTSGEAIVWIIGKRADNRFKVTPLTKQILKIELK